MGRYCKEFIMKAAERASAVRQLFTLIGEKVEPLRKAKLTGRPFKNESALVSYERELAHMRRLRFPKGIEELEAILRMILCNTAVHPLFGEELIKSIKEYLGAAIQSTEETPLLNL